jgi:hypothetical protein
MAESFSATATLINWFRATPSSSAVLRASSSRDGWSLSAKSLFFIMPPHLSSASCGVTTAIHHAEPIVSKSLRLKVDQQIRFPGESHFKYHLIIGVLQKRSGNPGNPR